MNDVPLQLFDPRLRPALKVEPLGAGIDLERPQRFNYFTIAWGGAAPSTFLSPTCARRRASASPSSPMRPSSQTGEAASKLKAVLSAKEWD